jgi:N-acetylmuramoyl-L-alanine amidase
LKKVIAMILILQFLSTTVMPSQGFAEKMVVIDPGHGGKYSGTCGYSGRSTGYCEKNANLDVALKLEKLLKLKGITVKLTRTTDVEFGDFLRDDEGSTEGGDFHNRMQVANDFVAENNENAVFISIHHNANPTNPFIRGIETYYYDGLNHFKSEYPHDPLQLTFLQENKRLAETVHQKLVSNLEVPNRKIHSDQSFYVIRNAQMPSILVELGFMINRHEEKMIKTDKYQLQAASAIAEAIDSYFSVNETSADKIGTFSNEAETINNSEYQITEYLLIEKMLNKRLFKSIN